MNQEQELMRQLRIGVRHNEDLAWAVYRETSEIKKPRDRNIVLKSLGLRVVPSGHPQKRNSLQYCEPMSNKDLASEFDLSRTTVSTTISRCFSWPFLRGYRHWRLIGQHLDAAKLRSIP